MLRNAAMFCGGLGLGAVNTVRHHLQGYTSPRPFDPADIKRTIDHAAGVVDHLEAHGASWTGKRVLEIGPGPDLATGAMMLARGAASYRAVDLFDNRSQAHPSLYDALAERIGPIDRERLEFIQTAFPGLPGLDGEYDMIVSNACLEHVADPGALFLRLRDFTAPGCLHVHHIDSRSHMRWFRDNDPLNVLRYPDWLYRVALDFPGAPNRLRGSDFQRLAKQAGWDAHVTPNSVIPLDGVHVAKRWREYEDVNVLLFTLVAQA